MRIKYGEYEDQTTLPQELAYPTWISWHVKRFFFQYKLLTFLFVCLFLSFFLSFFLSPPFCYRISSLDFCPLFESQHGLNIS